MKYLKNYFILKTLTSFDVKIKNIILGYNLHNFPKLKDFPTLSVFEKIRQLIALKGIKSVTSLKKTKIKLITITEINY